MRKIILASTSPRRYEILSKLGLPFEVKESNYEEDMSLEMSHVELVEHLALQKAQAVALLNPDALIIAADTFVVYNEHRMGKPFVKERAKEMLEMLSGKQHQIITGVAIIDTESGKTLSFHEVTHVFMANLTPEIIDAYIQTGEPLDKAGAYALQEKGALLIEKIEGDFFSAMGLPLRRLALELKGFGVQVL